MQENALCLTWKLILMRKIFYSQCVSIKRLVCSNKALRNRTLFHEKKIIEDTRDLSWWKLKVYEILFVVNRKVEYKGSCSRFCYNAIVAFL